MIILTLVKALILLAGPAALLLGEKRFKFLSFTGAVVNSYILGVIIGNLPLPSETNKIAQDFSEATVLLAIPLLLLPTDFVGWLKLARATVISFISVVVAVMLSSYVAGHFFAPHVDEAWKIAGMLVGVYTGGTPNLTAIGKALEVKHETFLIMNAADMFLGGLYLLFLMTIGVRVYGWFLPKFKTPEGDEEQSDFLPTAWETLALNGRFKMTLLLLSGAALAAGLSVGLTYLILGQLQVAVIILLLTLFGLGASFIPKWRQCAGASEIGNYLLLIFCVSIGSLADVDQLMTGSGPYILFCAIVMLMASSLHYLACVLFRIDRDTALITMVAGIFGPAFIPAMAKIMHNRWILVSGITTGLVGYAVGNFAGLLVAWLLKP